MARRAPAARVALVAAILASAGGVSLAAAARFGLGDAPVRPAPVRPAPVTTTTAPSGVLDLGLPPLPPLPTLVPDAALADVPPAQGDVAVFGDSLTLQAWPYLEAIAAHQGRALTGAAYGGVALCDWLPVLEDMLGEDPPAELVLAFAGNNLTPCVAASDGRRRFGDDLAAAYTADAETAIGLARASGARVVLAGPPAMRGPVGSAHGQRLQIAFARLAQAADVDFVDLSEALSPDGYTRTLPCLAFETGELGCALGRIVVREDDGVHLSAPNPVGYSAGAWRYAIALLEGPAAPVADLGG